MKKEQARKAGKRTARNAARSAKIASAPKPKSDADGRRTADLLRDALEQEIVLGDISAGERLDEISLAERFGVSRTPIREALAQLAAIGLVELKPRRGAFVREVTFRDVIEMFEVMAELEAMCARLAARRITPVQLQTLNEAHKRCTAAAKAGDTDLYYYENESFHGQIYAACGNRFLAEQTANLRNRLKPYRRLQLRVAHRVAGSLDEHGEIIAAIEARDEAKVDSLIKAHIVIQGEKLNLLLAEMSDAAHKTAAE